ncbi:soluble lytic murein transglycosylase [Stenotrophomonas maltophilia SKK35]|uniref:Lytic transglycosylase domain-containing protein n=1 Tax=Stenotrophomonas maltophilia TaxID=40324 RepID=A0AAJ2JFT9_STEMA|nr:MULTISPECIES: lytic transglycosylase domain-containing protein [Stenotrophomonas]CCP10812.1 soluble lytic murein transglycosylase [Stenotrophomonas maltophilia SKK35]MBH1365756.1 lytic transglycosylase domain-containing protein [Stenotrophomonas maltophilia]MDQ7280808.1 lytic transglycosylase domain-containing protein [Stenotrophomonas sp. Sm6012]MDT3469044.1 lytic transglycosylase domain-containing protein [Stenotrophomonas maltophilia]HDS1126216.1 lytic transglycosylase domain-containing 
MKGILGTTAIIIAALTAAPASAGTLYKCQGADGVTSYVSKRVAGARCSAISYSRDTRPVSRPVVAAPKPAPATTVASIERNPVAVAASAATPAVAAPAPAPASVPTAATASRGGRMVSGQVYSFMKDGVRHYTSARPTQVANLGPVRTIRYSFMERCYACGVNPRVDFGTVRLNTTAFQGEITSAAREFGVEEAVVRAIIHAESAYNPTALSRAGAQGLMQLMPPTAARFGVSDSYDAGQNIRGGVQYLAWLLKRFNGDLTLAAAGYNAGEGAVDRHGGVPPYSETQYYVRRVGQLADRYRSALSHQ